jgi:hypothetical protein
LSEKSHKKYQHEKCAVLLDDCFCNDDVAKLLTEAGFTTAQFTTYFPRVQGVAGGREQGVKDPKVISLSHRLKMVIFTTDHRMCEDHRKEFLKHPSSMVVATSHNSYSDEVWAKAFIKAKPVIERLHKKQHRPWYAKINQLGQITVCKSYAAAA